MAVFDTAAGSVLDISAELTRRLGLTPGPVVTLDDVRTRIFPGELEKVQAAAQAALQAEQRTFEAEYRFHGPDETPGWMQQTAALLPLKWLNQGMRSAFLPDEVAAFEPAGGWEHGRTALILAAWAIIGVMVCVRTFRWRRGEG